MFLFQFAEGAPLLCKFNNEYMLVGLLKSGNSYGEPNVSEPPKKKKKHSDSDDTILASKFCSINLEEGWEPFERSKGQNNFSSAIILVIFQILITTVYWVTLENIKCSKQCILD